MVSDDTEHSCMVLQALLASGNNEGAFIRNLATRMRIWLLGLPAGVGLATLKATLKLCCGVSPYHSGVFSAGNGPAMRSAVLGAAIEDMGQLRRFVRVSTRLTHTDPKAEYGAMAIAVAAHMAGQGTLDNGPHYMSQLRQLFANDSADELLALLDQAVCSVAAQKSSQEFADSLGQTRGVSGYVYHTVPVAIHACLRNRTDFRNAVMEVISCGGDTDTTAAIVGGVVGAGMGKDGIPREWLDNLWEWPRTIQWMQRLASQVSQPDNAEKTMHPVSLPLVGVLLRNVVFLIVVLFHGFRRLLPPY